MGGALPPPNLPCKELRGSEQSVIGQLTTGHRPVSSWCVWLLDLGRDASGRGMLGLRLYLGREGGFPVAASARNLKSGSRFPPGELLPLLRPLPEAALVARVTAQAAWAGPWSWAGGHGGRECAETEVKGLEEVAGCGAPPSAGGGGRLQAGEGTGRGPGACPWEEEVGAGGGWATAPGRFGEDGAVGGAPASGRGHSG